MMRQFELVERVKSYDPSADEDLLNRAYVYTMKQHGAQMRASGDPYFSHPIEVAGILTRYKLDTASIVSALLHDTIEDTSSTHEDIERRFGPDVARLVDGVTKLSRIELQSDRTKQAENFRKLVLAMSEDIRVLLIKLADRLHNMRTLKHIKDPEKRRRIALETMEIYAPLAERIGMSEIENELEDLAFAELHPDARDSIVARLNFLREQGGKLIERIISEMKRTLADAGIVAEVSGREKMPYSIWRKMQLKNVTFEQLADIMAFRVIVKDVSECYLALGVIHSRYQMVPGRFKDYISTPKPNGYKSIHTGVFGPERHRIEIQIRTREMHEVAELGVAAHWTYKSGERPADGTQYRWLREMLEVMEHASSPEEFLEHTKLEIFQDQVFCFTPQRRSDRAAARRRPGRFRLRGSLQVGDTCVGAKINGRIMPLRTPLNNGDQVEIVTSKAQTPNPTWERFVVTAKARARIRRFVRMQARNEYLDLGRAILTRAFKQEGYELTDKALEGRSQDIQDGHARRPDRHGGRGDSAWPRRGGGDLSRTQNAAEGRQCGDAQTGAPKAVGHARRSDSRTDSGHGDAFRRLLPSAARRSHRRHRHHRQGRDDPYHRLRNAGPVRRHAPSGGSISPGMSIPRTTKSISAASIWWLPTSPAAWAACRR